jgi:hypothetical protein
MVMPYLESAIAFVLVMLAGSLLVNIVVRLIHAYTGERARGVQDLLGQLHRGFCDHRQIVPDDYHLAREAFLDAVLSAPILHDARTMAAADAEVLAARDRAAEVAAVPATGSAAAAEERRLATEATVRSALARRRAKLWAGIEYVSQPDLLAIVRASAGNDGILPASWFGGAPVAKAPPTRLQQRLLEVRVAPSAVRGTVSARDFHDYCRRWFPTAEATVRQRFSVAARKASVSVSALIVVLLNLDALRLGYDLYKDRVMAENLARRQDDIAAVAQRAVASEPAGFGKDTPDQSQTVLDLQKTAAVLTIERVPLGWQDAYIVKRWCAYHDACEDPSVPKPTPSAMKVELLMWLLGLVVSWVMLSLGAPFWVDLLKRLGGLANALSARPSSDPHRTETAAWEHEGAAQGAPDWYREAADAAAPPAQLQVEIEQKKPADDS